MIALKNKNGHIIFKILNLEPYLLSTMNPLRFWKCNSPISLNGVITVTIALAEDAEAQKVEALKFKIKPLKNLRKSNNLIQSIS